MFFCFIGGINTNEIRKKNNSFIHVKQILTVVYLRNSTPPALGMRIRNWQSQASFEIAVKRLARFIQPLRIFLYMSSVLGWRGIEVHESKSEGTGEIKTCCSCSPWWRLSSTTTLIYF